MTNDGWEGERGKEETRRGRMWVAESRKEGRIDGWTDRMFIICNNRGIKKRYYKTLVFRNNLYL